MARGVITESELKRNVLQYTCDRYLISEIDNIKLFEILTSTCPGTLPTPNGYSEPQ